MKPYNVAIVGGGPGCVAIMDMISGDRLRQLQMRLCGIVDLNPEAPGVKRAKALNIFTFCDYHDLFPLPSLDLIIELTGNPAVSRAIEKEKPAHIQLVDHRVARLFWDILNLEDEKLRTEKAMEKSQKKYKDLFDNAREGLVIFDQSGVILENNFSFAGMLGRKKSELENTKIHQLAQGHSRAILEKHLEGLKSLGFTTVEMDFVHKNGTILPLEITLSWHPDDHLFRIMARDITMKRKLEDSRRLYSERLEQEVLERTRELERREAFVQNLIQNSIDGIIATGEKGQIAIFNRGAAEILGYEPDDIIGKMNIQDLVSDENGIDIRKAFSDARHGPAGKIIHVETTLRNKSAQPVPVRLSGALLYENKKELGSVIFVQDLREMRRLRKEKEQAQRMAAVGKTVAGLAHYIRNILNGLSGGAYVINSAVSKADISLVRKGWGMVEKNIDQIANIVTDMLIYSGDRPPLFEWVDPNALLEKILEQTEPRANTSGVMIVLKKEEGLGLVALDKTGIHRCLLNLISNAIDACALEGIVEGKGAVTVSTDRPEGWAVRFQVTDNGTGMNKETQKRLFTDFFTTKGYKGTGLGLPVTQKIVEAHGGTLTFESQVGRGTTFTLMLPEPPPE